MDGLRLVLAGAAVGNGNRGVEALGRSVIDAVDRDAPGASLSVLDDGWGVRTALDGRYASSHLEYVGVRLSRRWHRPESWAQVRVAQALSDRRNPVARRFAIADAVLDLSAGDSFTDLYGPARLKAVSAPKEAALRAGRPLVLLPQTYGPFTTERGRRSAERLVRSAALAYARDAWSHDRLLELAGPDADPGRLRSGVDVAFALQPRRPEVDIVELEASEGPTAGVNVSGLLRDAAGSQRFGLAGDYVETMTLVVRALIRAGAKVFLVPHVHERGGHGESDAIALTLVRERLDERERARTIMLPPHLDAAELKWCIGQLDWFVGSRMHSTIAALSTSTPAAAYAYSDKTRGVFETCGLGGEVVDARRVGGREAAEAIVDGFERREATKLVLAPRVAATVQRSRDQLGEVFEAVARWRDGATRAEELG